MSLLLDNRLDSFKVGFPMSDNALTKFVSQPKTLADSGYADHPLGLALRSAIAAVPFVGGSISVLVESRLSALQSARIDALYARIRDIENSFKNQLGDYSDQNKQNLAPYSESLLEAAVLTAMRTADDRRPEIIANILYNPLQKDDPSELVRRFLLEICSTLTRYEFALLMHYSRTDMSDKKSDYALALLKIQVTDPGSADIWEFSMNRLYNFKLVTSTDPDAELTNMGTLLLSVI